MSGEPVAALADVPSDGTLLFRVESVETGEEREAILVRADGSVAGWLNDCQHFTHIRLDKGDGAPVRDGELVCTNHGAMFEADTGLCTFGPCEGAFLNAVDVKVEDGAVLLSDPDYAYAGPGGIETDDWDLGSTSNVEF